jgi:cell division protein FtsI (penicillin-binding protein 3)
MTVERRIAERMQRTLRLRRRVLLGGWIFGAVVLAARAGQIQVVQRASWQEQAEGQHQSSESIVAPRGRITDRDGMELALSHEIYRVALAPGEINDVDEVVRRLSLALGMDAATARRYATEDRRWRQLPGKHTPQAGLALKGLRGVHLERQLERFYPHGDLGVGVLGRVFEGVGRGGIEQRFEDVLRGVPGRAVYAHDNQGRPIPGQALVVDQPREGGSVVLTLDLDLQEIGEEIIAQAVAENQALGGDLLITDPNTGDILAMASVREGNTAALSAINTPYEPGSTLKPITVSGILDRGLMALDDSIDIENGRWTINGRTLSDVGSGRGVISLARALQTSSNVGIAKAAQVLEAADQFQTLRDFGFGAPTGLGLAGEVAGTLRRPEDWSSQSSASLAIGYEIGVTPLQMAMAYGAIANGGELMEPRLIREVRGGDGRVLQRFEPRAIRRVVSREVTRAITGVLVDVVEDGTGTRARLASFAVAGKSGTARAWSEGGYKAGDYFASFVGFFPADNPQLVVLVKLDRPHGHGFYGGALAAPVTKATMEAILAARQTPLDRRALTQMARSSAPRAAGTHELRSPVPGRATEPLARFAASGPADQNFDLSGRDRAGNIELPDGGLDRILAGDGLLTVPELRGLPARQAARRLHSLGFRVLWEGPGAVAETVPAAGERLAPGDTIRLRPGRRGDG